MYLMPILLLFVLGILLKQLIKASSCMPLFRLYSLLGLTLRKVFFKKACVITTMPEKWS